jgi:chromosome segregation ATPase
LEKVRAYIKSIQLKTAALVKEHQQLKAQYKQALEQVNTAANNTQKMQEQILQLQQEQLILKASLNTLNEADKKQLEKQINSYIKNIDKCITLLSHKTNL